MENGVLAPKSSAARMANETPLKDVSRFALVSMAHILIAYSVGAMIMSFFGRTTGHFHYAKHIVWLTAPTSI